MPLKVDQIAQILSARGYEATHQTKKKEAYTKGNGEVVYLNLTSRDGTSSLILHPRWESRRNEIRGLVGVHVGADSDYYHSSNMRLFPKRKHKGENEISYGISLTFDGDQALSRFLALFEGAEVVPQPTSESELAEFAPSTEREASILGRVGHDRFRDELMMWWGTCAVTELSSESLLRASHIKPWRDASDSERLDPFNGLLLAPHLDAAFDRGYISFDDSGRLLCSSELSREDAIRLGLSETMQLRRVAEQHLPYLAYHASFEF
jgi:hypothetical protein